ncbi:secondary thiamine-phosphate synthase enzyme YjbQ [Halorientalis marina]|jgi:secondary thiamine-phosphate synthase enzyme|uniref:secondary thiamine-phosphate synthase enzyme YjbQ n=1 Tax=Halorientalis marina TaxID=2931976 RepID=UPI001FF57B7C|nr:secondary thiamine-phosphate synthase enzyme YjbQ [Halorientalis marina]
MSHRRSIEVSTDERVTTVELTDRVEAAVPETATGTCTVFVEHTTAGLSINEAEPRLREDIERALTELVPESGWAHDEIDDNADAHLRSMLLGRSVTVPVTDGSLDLGTWQSILLVECDGPRTRTVSVTA